MTAQERKALHDSILMALKPPVYPRGYSAEFLHVQLRSMSACSLSELEAELHYFKECGFIEVIAPDKHNPDLPPFYKLTAEGVRETRNRALA